MTLSLPRRATRLATRAQEEPFVCAHCSGLADKRVMEAWDGVILVWCQGCFRVTEYPRQTFC